jgi:hypothetical protein
MTLPSFETYGNYSSGNYGAHALVFSLPNGIDVYFSYKTPVAFRNNGHVIVRQNDWGPTTGKHLNAIDGGDKDAKNRRLPGDQFETALQSVFNI